MCFFSFFFSFATDSCRNTCKFLFFTFEPVSASREFAFTHRVFGAINCELFGKKNVFWDHKTFRNLVQAENIQIWWVFLSYLGQYRFAGQNLAWRGQSWAFEDVTSLMVNSMLIWFNEYELTDQSAINKCCGWNM